MTSMDKAGIIIAIAVVAVALSITSFSGSLNSGFVPAVEESTISIKEASQSIQESSSEAIEKISETTKQAAKETKEFGEVAKELATSKSSSRLVSIPSGTSIPGCEKVDLCYDPPSLIIFKGAEIIWRNDDTSSHTVTSGNIIEGPNGIFDSGLINVDATFSFKFKEVGSYDYFCMIHPWANGSVIVT